MHTSMNSLLICLPIIVSLITNNSVEAAVQTSCTRRVATPFNANFIPKLKAEWYVLRATIRTQLPSDIPWPTMNNCTPITYFDSCKGAIYINRKWENNGDVTKYTKAYSEQYDNIATYEEVQTRSDPNFFTWKSKGIKMALKFRDGTSEDIDLSDVPVVKNALARFSTMNEYGFLYANNDITWMLYIDCEEDFAWIEVADFVLDNQAMLNEANSDIDNYISNAPAGFLPPMVPLPLKLPFQA